MKIEQENDVCVAKLDPSYSALQEEHLAETIRSLLQTADELENPKLIMDFSSTEYFGTAFFEVLSRVSQRLTKRGGGMAICGLRPLLLDLFQKARMDAVWPICNTRSEAAAELKGAGKN